jgi:hypothetical protein
MDKTEETSYERKEDTLPMRVVNNSGNDRKANEKNDRDNRAADPPRSGNFWIFFHGSTKSHRNCGKNDPAVVKRKFEENSV